MSNTLDRLKALSDKLEVKLASKTDDTVTAEEKPSKVVAKAPKKRAKSNLCYRDRDSRGS